MKTILKSPLQSILLFLLIITVSLKLGLVTLPSFKFDMNTWLAWTGKLVEVGPAKFYSPGYFADYFPGYLYLLWFLGSSFIAAFSALQIFSPEFEIYLKLFTNLFDLLSALIIYKIVSKHRPYLKILAPLLYLINPALTFNSSIWGQVDGILAFFLIYSVYSLLESKKPFLWGGLSGISLLVKPQGLPALPIAAIYLLRNFKPKSYLSLFLIPLVPVILSLPFFLQDPILGLFHLLQKSANTYPYTSMFSYNLWSFANWWVPDSTSFGPFTYQIWGVVLFSAAYLLIILPLIFTKNQSSKVYYLAIALSLFAFFLFPTRIHQRYLLAFFPFLLVYACLVKSFRLILLYYFLSLIHLINLWYVYYYYNYVYINSAFSKFFIYDFLSRSFNLFSLLNLVSFFILMLIYYKSLFKKHHD